MLKRFVLALGLLGAWIAAAGACPFCQAIKNTMSEEIAAVDAAVFAKLVSAEKVDPEQAATGAAPAKARFEIVEVLKGQKLVGERRLLDTVFFGEPEPGKMFLIVGVDPTNLQWATPTPVTERSREYIKKASALPKEGVERLAFIQNYFEDAEPFLAADAYDEFAKSPYADIKALKPNLHREKLVNWVKDENVPVAHRRQYLSLLGVCGTADDVPLLEEMLKDPSRKYKGGLDSLIACYINLAGPKALDLVDELFLQNKEAEYADTYAAIMALRFHVGETDVVPKERALKSLHYMLERPLLADLVIPDLARMEDWSVNEQLVKLFKDANEKNSWVRVPVVNYLRACPLPEAKEQLKELEKIDPQAVKRANTFFPVGPSPSTTPKSSQNERRSSDQKLEDLEAAAMLASADVPLPPPDVEEPAPANPVAAHAVPEVALLHTEPAANPLSLSVRLGVALLVGLSVAGVWFTMQRLRTAPR